MLFFGGKKPPARVEAFDHIKINAVYQMTQIAHMF